MTTSDWWRARVVRIRQIAYLQTALVLCRDMFLIAMSCVAMGGVVLMYTANAQTFESLRERVITASDQHRDDRLFNTETEIAGLKERIRLRDEEAKVRDQRIATLESKQTLIEGIAIGLGSLGVIAQILKTILGKELRRAQGGG